MPIVSVPEHVLFRKLKASFTEEEFTDLCFAFGLELDEITSEQELAKREQGDVGVVDTKSDTTIYKVEVPANRYDLLCAEGLTRALLIFQGKIAAPEYRAILPMPHIQIRASPNVLEVRPFVVAAVLRNIAFDEDRYASFIDLQDKLHQTIGRKRSIVAIGTHDLDTLRPPFVYDAQPPSKIRFRPLNQTQAFTATEMTELYSKESHLKPYIALLKGHPKYPIILDSKGTVLSMPPVINGEHSKLKLTTRNVFIECTATDLHKASITLDTIVCMFSEYCATPFTVEPVEVIQADNSRSFFPRLEYRNEVVSVDYINSLLGTACSEGEIINLLTSMGLSCQSAGATSDLVAATAAFSISRDQVTSGLVSVRIPPTRQDILHPCDIAEDVAISYGYDRIEEHLPTTYNIVSSHPLNRLTDMVRAEVAQYGFTEALTFSLCSRADISTNLQKPLEGIPAVHISNPKTLDFQVVRTTLLPGLLHTLANNKSLPLPLKLFEVQDVVLKDPTKDVGCRNLRRVCAVYCNKTSGFEVVHGLLDRLMLVLEAKYVDPSKPVDSEKLTYHLEEVDDKTYFPGRCADIILTPPGTSIGRLGIVHPQVLQNFGLTLSVSSFEINLEPFL
uniref:Phenylalanine--tRNA ligase beta subunit n=1 Tax=Schistocephalus solidus TaxID=70667 RepID=A0A0X3NVE5_SCHSO